MHDPAMARRKRGLSLALWILALAAAILPLVVAYLLVPPPPPRLERKPVAFADIPGWPTDDHGAALAALLRSCARMTAKPHTISERRDAWLEACAAAERTAPLDARRFFETRFEAFSLSFGGKQEGLLTGYYEPELRGSRVPTPEFHHPLYVRPADLVTVDLGRFAPDLAGRQLVGRLKDGSLVPYPTRAEIAAGALAGANAELLWVDDPVGAFFLEIQGSGRVVLPDGELVRIGYAAKNGHPYRAIGRVLVEMGEMTLEEVSLPAIRQWLQDHPDRAQEVMNANPSHVFFRELPDEGPLGSEGVVLTPGRSLAVDRRHIPLGTPVWIAGNLPEIAGGGPLRRLVVAQDTGGAITGALRGDLFWGPGLEAEDLAGHMRDPARFYILLPRMP